MENVPVRTHSTTVSRHVDNQEMPPIIKKKAFFKRKPFVIAAILIVLAVASLAGWFCYQNSSAAAIDTSKYQAVFFTNGQVYFGKLRMSGDGYMKLTDIFYLQSTSQDPKNPQQTSSSSDVQLIKLGDEIHGPVDEMVINKDQVLFFENLKSDGKVSQSITVYHKK
jgi:hypothetical protein